jgi:PucR C-terminal helix-turn-helix domain
MSQENALADIVRRADTADVARRMVEMLLEEIAAYRRLPAAAIEGEVRQVAQQNVELFLDSLVQDRSLTEEELQPFRESARRRAAEGLPLEDLLAAYRLGGRLGWEALIEAATPEERVALLPTVSRLMEQVDRVSDAVTETYHEWSSHIASEEERRARDLLGALLNEIPFDEEMLSLAERRSVRLADEYVPFALALENAATHQHLRYAADLRNAGVLAVTEREKVVGLLGEAESDGALRLDHRGAVYALGEPTPRAELRSALADLGTLVDVAMRDGGAGRVDLEDHLPELLLASSPRLAERVRRRVLAPIEAYSERRRADLLETLETFVACDLDRRRAAERLHVHPNTLDYRLRRVEELTDLRLSSASDLLLICLALRQRAAHVS